MNGFDLWLLHVLNNWVARSPASFYRALDYSDHLPWILAAVTIVALWFVGEDGVIPTRPGGMTRLESRRRILLIVAAMVFGFMFARVFQSLVERARPLVDIPLNIPIDPSVWNKVRNGLSLQGAFPSDHAVLFFVLVVGVFSINKSAGFVSLLTALYFSALRVGIGFHYPSDMLGGALIGGILTFMFIWLSPLIRWALDKVVLGFYHYPMLAYAVGYLFLIDLSQKFAGLFGIVKWIAGYAVAH